MGRFLNSQIRRDDQTVAPLSPSRERAPEYPPAPTGTAAVAVSEETPSVVQWIGLGALCVYLLSGFLTEVSLRAFGGHAHVPIISLAIAFGAFALGGGLHRSFQSRIGKLWWFFLFWLIVCVPFSYWRTGSIELLLSYVPRSHFTLFFICAFVVNLKQCRAFMLFGALSGYVLLLWCRCLGLVDPEGGRFLIPDSLFYANANDLGIQLVVSLGSFVYLLQQRSVVLRIMGLAGLPIAMFYMLKTGSRGAGVAFVAFLVVAFWYAKGAFRLGLVLAVGLTFVVALTAIPSSTMSRLTLIFLHPEEHIASGELQDQQQRGSVGSQIARWELLKLSLWYTITHPVFGVGPGEFMDRVEGDEVAKGRRSGWLGTHNTYTQVSSECGLPGAFAFIAVLWITFRTLLRLYQQTLGQPALAPVNQVAFALLVSTTAFAVSAFFHHLAYTGGLAILAGQAVAIAHAAHPLLQSPRQDS